MILVVDIVVWIVSGSDLLGAFDYCLKLHRKVTKTNVKTAWKADRLLFLYDYRLIAFVNIDARK